MKSNEKGIALITTLVLGLVALVFISGFLYIILTSTKTSGTIKTYTSALEVAKGTASYLMSVTLDGALKCDALSSSCNDCLDNGNCDNCENDYTNCKLDVSNLQNKISDYDIEAYLLTKEVEGNIYIYSFKVKAKKKNGNEKSEIDFVYKVEEK